MKSIIRNILDRNKHMIKDRRDGVYANVLWVIFLRLILLTGTSLLANDTTSVLFLGSSYFNYNNLPAMFDSLANNSGHEVLIQKSIRSGLYLSDHASSASTESLINQRDWDFVVLQGVGSLTAYPITYPDHPLLPALEILEDKIHQNCESTKMVFCMPWAYEDGMTWVPGWTDTFEDMQIHIYHHTLAHAENVGFSIAPVGWSWYGVLEEMNYPLHYLHLPDWNHPSLLGSYLMACTIYSTIFLETSVGNEYISELDSGPAGLFQSIATDTVLNHLDLWNLSLSGTNSFDPIASPSAFTSKAYPNPFNPTTTISYDLPEESEVSLIIYDVAGRLVQTLVSTSQAPGRYTASWKGTDQSGKQVAGGMYLARLQAGAYSSVVMMVYLR